MEETGEGGSGVLWSPFLPVEQLMGDGLTRAWPVCEGWLLDLLGSPLLTLGLNIL